MRLNLGISRRTTVGVRLVLLLVNLFFWYLAKTVGLHSTVGAIYYIYFLPSLYIDYLLRSILRLSSEMGPSFVEICVIQYLLLVSVTLGVLALWKTIRSQRAKPDVGDRTTDR